MRFPRLGFALLVATSICSVSYTRAQDCTCGGSAMNLPYGGGNGQPLKWLYAPYVLVSPPPPAQKLICYLKQVDNKGNDDVRDVRRKVANFFRRVIPRIKRRVRALRSRGRLSQLQRAAPYIWALVRSI